MSGLPLKSLAGSLAATKEARRSVESVSHTFFPAESYFTVPRNLPDFTASARTSELANHTWISPDQFTS